MKTRKNTQKKRIKGGHLYHTRAYKDHKDSDTHYIVSGKNGVNKGYCVLPDLTESNINAAINARQKLQSIQKLQPRQNIDPVNQQEYNNDRNWIAVYRGNSAVTARKKQEIINQMKMTNYEKNKDINIAILQKRKKEVDRIKAERKKYMNEQVLLKPMLQRIIKSGQKIPSNTLKNQLKRMEKDSVFMDNMEKKYPISNKTRAVYEAEWRYKHYNESKKNILSYSLNTIFTKLSTEVNALLSHIREINNKIDTSKYDTKLNTILKKYSDLKNTYLSSKNEKVVSICSDIREFLLELFTFIDNSVKNSNATIEQRRFINAVSSSLYLILETDLRCPTPMKNPLL